MASPATTPVGNASPSTAYSDQDSHQQSQLPAAEPPLTRAQLDARFEMVEQQARARRREAVEDARERQRLEPAGAVRRRLVFD